MASDPDTVTSFFDGHPEARARFAEVERAVARLGHSTVRVTKSQVAFRRRRGFAWVWLPGRWLRRPGAEAVLSIALARHDASPRWKEVAHPTERVWMHHLELPGPGLVDAEVRAWLAEAYAAAG
jgi:Domain of unknown function (DUF5655)